MNTNSKEITGLVNKIKATKKYKRLSPDTIENIVEIEFDKGRRSIKDVEKAAKKKLHLVLADYLCRLDYNLAEKELKASYLSGNRDCVLETVQLIMARHSSSLERLNILAKFFLELFKITGEPTRLADLACALIPFSFPWMGLSRDVEYHAFDNNMKTVELVNLYFQLEGLRPLAEVRDILCHPPEGFFDVALLLKMYHCLERRRKGAGWEVIEKTPARWLVVSFPTQNLAERDVDIYGNYKKELLARTRAKGWHYRTIKFKLELVLLINKTGDN